jgi:hypothetical protein
MGGVQQASHDVFGHFAAGDESAHVTPLGDHAVHRVSFLRAERVIVHRAIVGTEPLSIGETRRWKGALVMKLPESLDQLPTNGAAGRAYGEPYRTADGATVIPVARVRGSAATPIGVFVVHGDKASWVSAVDENRVALIGVTTGLLAAVITCLAVLRRPPWPDLSYGR